MTNKEIIKSITFIIRELNRCENFIAGICYDKLHLPNYYSTSPKLNECCKYCNSRDELKPAVKEFYSSLSDECEHATCPMGLDLEIRKELFGDKKLFILCVGGFNKSYSNMNLFNDHNRVIKKAYRRTRLKGINIIAGSNYLSNVDNVRNAIATMVAGKYSLVIRALSHSVFTNIQGAIADLDNIKNRIDMDSSVERLTTNLEAISETMGEIQIVMNDQFVVHENMLRQINIIKMVRRIIEIEKTTAEQKHVRFNMGYIRTQYIHAVPSYYSIAITNIVANAVKYSFKGFPDSPLSININDCSNDIEFGLEIENIGCFIEESEIKDRRIFELGYRGMYSDDRGRSGTGSGLYIADKIISAHGGKINVECEDISSTIDNSNKRGKISFRIYIPY